MPGSDPSAQLGAGASLIDGGDGRQAVAVGKEPLAIPIAAGLVPPGPITVAVWVRTRPGPFMGRLFEVPGVTSFGFKQGGLNASLPSASWSSAMLSSWTHICVTWDGTTAVG